jgi:geranylgeranyl pyrophosphate synthase
VVAGIRGSGAIDESMDRARSYIAQGQDALSTLPDNQSRSILHRLADYAVSRQM